MEKKQIKAAFFTNTLTITKNGAVTLPADVRHFHNIEPGDQLESYARNGTIVLLLPPVNKRPKAYARLLQCAIELFDGHAESAAAWLHDRQFALDGERPVDVMRTAKGTKEVEDLIRRIEHGVGA